MAGVAELMLRIKADLNEAEKKLGGFKGTVNKVGDAMFKGGLLIAGTGAAMAGLGKKVEPLNQAIDRVAASTGIQTDKLRDLALGLTDATFPLEDVTRGMERLVAVGIDNEKQMEAILPVLDNFSDATGKDIVESIDLFNTVLSALNIPLEEAGDHIDTMTYLVTQTDIPLSTLQRNLGRVPEELDALNFGLDESAAAIMYFRDQGYSGQEAVREFRRAVAESEGDMEAFMEITGLTAEELELYQKEIEAAGGLTDDLAEINNRSITVWDNVKQRFEEVIFEHGELIEVGGQLGQVMMGVGPIISGVGKGIQFLTNTTALQTAATKTMTAVKKVATVTMKGFGIAVKIATGPVGLIILAVAGLIAAGVALYRNWDTVKEKAAVVWGAIRDVIRGPANSIIGFANGIITAFERMINSVAGAINRIPKFNIPDWVPVVGGKSFGLPRVPTASFPRIPLMDTGGLVKGPGVFQVGAGVTEVVRRYDPSNNGSVNIIVELDGQTIARAIGQPMVDEIRLRTGLAL